MNYRSLEDLVIDTKCFAKRISKNYDLIVGIPRSGLLVANILALDQNISMTDIDGFLQGNLISAGKRLNKKPEINEMDEILIVDDSVGSGRTMKKTKSRVNSLESDFSIDFAAIYITYNGYKEVDYWYEKVEKSRVFEWNLFHHKTLSDTCIEMEGVLCRQPKAKEKRNEHEYSEYVKKVKPIEKPSKRIGKIVTKRPAKFRKETIDWLKKYDIEYDELHMYEGANSESAMFKRNTYIDSNTKLFIEFSQNTSKNIAQESKKPVFCYSENRMFTPSKAIKTQRKLIEHFKILFNDPIWFIKYAPKYVAERTWHTINRYRNKK